jgi:hypothetical protein
LPNSENSTSTDLAYFDINNESSTYQSHYVNPLTTEGTADTSKYRIQKGEVNNDEHNDINGNKGKIVEGNNIENISEIKVTKKNIKDDNLKKKTKNAIHRWSDSLFSKVGRPGWSCPRRLAAKKTAPRIFQLMNTPPP